MANRCVVDAKLRFEFACDLEQTIFHAFTLRRPNMERESDDEEFKRMYDARWCCSRVRKKVLRKGNALEMRSPHDEQEQGREREERFSHSSGRESVARESASFPTCV
jgi:hypothetical protein